MLPPMDLCGIQAAKGEYIKPSMAAQRGIGY